jgi:biotin synthase
VDPFDFVRTIAVARLLMPASHVRLSAGREGMSDEVQALCFLAGANSIFYGEKLLTTGNPDVVRDQQLFARLGLMAEGTKGEGSDGHANGHGQARVAAASTSAAGGATVVAADAALTA